MPHPDSLWKISFNGELATYEVTSISLQHVKSNKFLGVSYYPYGFYGYYQPPVTEHTEGKNKYFVQIKFLIYVL